MFQFSQNKGLKITNQQIKQVGVDLGLKDFVITSDNKRFKNNRNMKN